MRVAQTYPATWRGRINPGAIDALHARAVEVMRAVTDNVPGLWDRLSRSAHALYVRIQKARSGTQSPSALARLSEEIVGLHANGVSSARLNLIPVALTSLIAQLDGPQPAHPQCLLEAMHEANLAGTGELVAESALALRPDRLLPLPALTELRYRTAQFIAALHVQLCKIDAEIQRQRAARGLRVLRGGRA